MKKLSMLAIIASLAFVVIACNKQTSEYNPAVLLSNYGPNTLTVTATYYGPLATDGSGKIYVYLFDTMGLTSRDPIYSGSTVTAATPGVGETITVEHIKDGDYYVLVFYDYHGGDNPDNQTDRYMLYTAGGSTPFANQADTFTVIGDTDLPGLSFGDTYKLQGQSKYLLPATLTVNATYNGATATTGTGKLFVFLYDSMGTDTRTPAPVYIASSTGAAAVGVQSQIVFSNILAGSYKAVLFYDYSAEVGHDDSVDDRYVIYDNRQYKDLADTITLADGGSQTWTRSFGDSYTLQADGAYMTASSPVTLTVNAAYTGAVTPDVSATGKLYAYLYDALGRATRLPDSPNYTGATGSAGTTGTITISGIVPGDYYIVYFYDNTYWSSNVDSPGDKYLLSGGVQYPGTATPVSLNSNTTVSPSINDDYALTTNVMGDALFMQTGSLTVHATYNGGVPSSTIGSMKIYVYLYDALGTGTRTGALPIYSGSTAAAVTVGVEDTISIANILPGNYYVLIFYDYRSGTNPDNQTDRYIFYNGVGYTSTASPLSVSGGTDLPGVSFNNTYTIQSSSLFMTP
jgi:hypothetical protein